jgi:glycerophosphoryl diester phosphodiesterase
MPRIGGGSIGAPGSGSGTGSVRFADLPTGWVITHRGAGSAIAPENTVEAFRIGAAYGTGFVDGGDWEITTDGALVMAHDPTVDRLTTSTGNANDLTAIQASRLVVDAGAWFGGGFGDTRFVTAEEMFGIYGRTAVLSPEPKSLAAVAPLVALIKRLGLQASVFPTAFNAAWLAPFQAAGCANVLLNITAPPTQAELDAYKAQGITWIGVPWQGTVVTPANVATIKANGFKVMAGTTNRQADYQPLAASGVDGWASDDPLYFAGALNPANVAKYRRATDPFKSQAYYHGHITSINSNPTSASDLAPLRRGTFLGGNRWGFQSWDGTAANPWVLQGWNCPVPNPTADYTITGHVSFDALGTDTSRFVGFFTAAPTDAGYRDAGATTETGYQCWMRANGGMNILKKVAGAGQGATISAATSLMNAPVVLSAPLAAGVTITALPVNALPAAFLAGALLALPNGQLVTLSGPAAAAATSVAINSFTPTATIPSGASLPHTAKVSVAHTATAVTFARLDSGGYAGVALTGLTDAATRGPYWHIGVENNNMSTGLWPSFSQITSV